MKGIAHKFEDVVSHFKPQSLKDSENVNLNNKKSNDYLTDMQKVVGNMLNAQTRNINHGTPGSLAGIGGVRASAPYSVLMNNV